MTIHSLDLGTFPYAPLNQIYIYPIMPISKQFLLFIVGEGSGFDIEVCIDSFMITGISSSSRDNVTHGPQTHRRNMLVRRGD